MTCDGALVGGAECPAKIRVERRVVVEDQTHSSLDLGIVHCRPGSQPRRFVFPSNVPLIAWLSYYISVCRGSYARNNAK